MDAEVSFLYADLSLFTLAARGVLEGLRRRAKPEPERPAALAPVVVPAVGNRISLRSSRCRAGTG